MPEIELGGAGIDVHADMAVYAIATLQGQVGVCIQSQNALPKAQSSNTNSLSAHQTQSNSQFQDLAVHVQLMDVEFKH
jgi:hypothetical protein